MGTDLISELNRIMNQELYGSNPKSKGTATYYIRGKVGNKKVCYTANKTYYNGKFGFYSWIQTHYKNRKIKRTKFAMSGSRIKCRARAEKLYNQLSKGD